MRVFSSASFAFDGAIRVRLLSVFLLFGANPSLVEASPWPSPPPEIETIVTEAFARNPGMLATETELDRAEARLQAASSAFGPRIDILARFTMADGGRTIDIPTGDLLNPVYETLDRLTGASTFPRVGNVSESLLREREQQTSLRLLQPLYRPEIGHGRRAARAQTRAAESRVAVFRRELRFRIQEAIHAHAQALAAVDIQTKALELVAESVRVNEALRAEGRATADAVTRARAELAGVEELLAGARRDVRLALARLNVLRARPLDAPAPVLPSAMLVRMEDALLALDPSILAASPAGREELAALRAAVVAAEAVVEAADARRRPTVALAVEAGIQGENYRTGGDHDFATASIVAEWNVFDARERRAAVAEAASEARAAAWRLDEATRLLELEVRSALEDFLVARVAWRAARDRVEAARSGWSLVEARQREGTVAQLVVLDARTLLTSAELGLELSRNRLFVAAARFERAAALVPLPDPRP
jgi:outer membrane protein TolC